MPNGLLTPLPCLSHASFQAAKAATARKKAEGAAAKEQARREKQRLEEAAVEEAALMAKRFK